jgi:hypothetical protein
MDVRTVIECLKAELRKVDTAIGSLEATFERSVAVKHEKFAKKSARRQLSNTPALGAHKVGPRERDR